MRTYLVTAKPPRDDFDEQQAAALEVAGFPPHVWDRSGSIIGWPNHVRRYVKIDADTGDAAIAKVAEVVDLEASELQALEVPSQRSA